jgi:hypothetical protein
LVAFVTEVLGGNRNPSGRTGENATFLGLSAYGSSFKVVKSREIWAVLDANIEELA